MRDFVIDSKELKKECIDINELISNSTHSISCTVFEEILFNENNYNKLKKCLLNSKITEIRIYKEFSLILKSSKVAFLEACLLYLKNYNYEQSNIYKELLYYLSSLNFINHVDTKEYNKIIIDNKRYNILSFRYFEFLDSNKFDELVKNKQYDGIPIEYFVYGLICYFDNNKLFYKYYFPIKMKKRFLELKNNKLVDYQSVNKILNTSDRLQKKVRLSQDVYNIINKKYDEDSLKNIIKVYLELCKIFIYDEKFYISSESDESRKHSRVSYLPYLNKRNNKIVCYEFPELFGAFLKSKNINYEIVGGNHFYGLMHNYLIFRYHKYLIQVEPVKTVYNTDFTNIRIGKPLIGISCINENKNTQEEFNNILNECYQTMDFTFDEYLPANKINNDEELENDVKKYLIKIDLILKKSNDLKAGPMEKASYFREMMYHLFNKEELGNNVFYSVVTDRLNLVYIIIINPDALNRDDNVYLIYQDNKLSIIDIEDLRELFKNGLLMKLKRQDIPGIDIAKKRS